MATSIQHGCVVATSIQDGCIMTTILNIEILKVALDKEITCIGSEVTKAVTDSVNKKAQDCMQYGRHQLKNVVIEN